ncbi:unnamed protein product [Merluccius merluccius]
MCTVLDPVPINTLGLLLSVTSASCVLLLAVPQSPDLCPFCCVCVSVFQMMKFAWDNYKRYAWGKNELRPLTRNGHIGNMFGGDYGVDEKRPLSH